MMPLVGETFEAFFILNDQTNIFMETDYKEYSIQNKATLKVTNIPNHIPTIYLHLVGAKNEYSMSGNLSYKSEWQGNNRVVEFIGGLKLHFHDLEGETQTVEIQLPNFVDANYYFSGKPRFALINGPLVMEDRANEIKCIVIFKGMEKQTTLCTDVWVANTKGKDFMKGIIYKQDRKKFERLLQGKREVKIETIKDIGDILYKISNVGGNLDDVLIEDAPLVD